MKSEEIKKWEDRVYFKDTKFQEINTQPGSIFYNGAKDISEKIYNDQFVVVSCKYESQVYKLARLFIADPDMSHSLMNEDFTFVEGALLAPYIQDNHVSAWDQQERVKEFVKHNANKFKNRIVLIPKIDCAVQPEVAIYLMDEIEHTNAMGVIYSNEDTDDSNLTYDLVKAKYPKIIQYPTKTIEYVRETPHDES